MESTKLDKTSLNVPFSKYSTKFSKDVLGDLKKKFFSEWMREREIILIDSNGTINSKEPKILIYSVNEIEAELNSSREKRADATNTSGMHQLDKYYIETEKSKTNNFLIDYENGILKILSRIKNRVHEYLTSVELDLIRGKNLSSYFDSTKSLVDQYLVNLSPQFNDKIKSLDERLNDGTEISYSQALLTIRVMIKDFADFIYPATNKPVQCSDGKLRILTDEKYVSRIWQYIFEQFKVTSSTSFEIVKEQIGDLGKRIDLVYQKSCKGVHTSVNSLETYQCIILFYVSLGDIIRLSSS